MDRRAFVWVICGSLATAGMAVAAGFEDAVVAQLQAQGYGQIRLERTLLGRVKIEAELNGMRREIILNPRTGEVLRDVLVDADGVVVPQIARASGTAGNSGGTNNSGGSGSGGSDDSGTDDDGSDDSGSDGDSGDDHDGNDSGNDDSDDDSGGDDHGGDDSSHSGGDSGSGGSGSHGGGDSGGGDDDED